MCRPSTYCFAVLGMYCYRCEEKLSRIQYMYSSKQTVCLAFSSDGEIPYHVEKADQPHTPTL